MEYNFKSVFCLGINSIEAKKEIGLEKLDEFPELNSISFFLIVVNAANKELKDRTATKIRRIMLLKDSDNQVNG
ncbi:hypothetical protein Tco_1434064 [Tanacetum coccineum]